MSNEVPLGTSRASTPKDTKAHEGTHYPGIGSERVVGRLDALGAQIYLALRAMMSGVDEHIHDHRPAIGIIAAFPGGNVPGALQLFRSDLWQDCEHVIEGLL